MTTTDRSEGASASMEELTAWAARPPKKRHTVRRTVLLVLLAYVLYLIVGMAAPFLFHPKVSPDFMAAFNPQSFYGVGSPDRAALVLDNSEALDLRLRMIAEAKERILFASFDIRDCESSRDIFAALLAAADRGVKIALLVDGANGLVSMSPKPMFRVLGRLPNVEIRYYNTPNLLMPWTFNGRMHDKYIIVDEDLLLLGGRNTFDLFLGDYVPDSQKSHDLDVLVANTDIGSRQSALYQVEDYFNTLWDGPLVAPALEGAPLFSGPVDVEEDALRARYQVIAEERPGLVDSAALDFEPYTVPVDKVSFLANPTNILAKEPWVWWQLQKLAEYAEERVVLMTPYAVLDEPMYEGLSRVADKTTLLLNSTAVGDNFMASSDYTFNRGHVIATGVTVSEWFGDYSSHGKAALYDDDLAVVGSYNWDMRSTYIDTELMLVFHGESFAKTLEAHLDEMEAGSLTAVPGGYLAKAGVAEKPLTGINAALYPVTAVVFQLIRFLL